MVNLRRSKLAKTLLCLLLTLSFCFPVFADDNDDYISKYGTDRVSHVLSIDNTVRIITTFCYPDLDENLIRAIIYHESGYYVDAVNCDGTCVGLMQVSTYWNAQRAEDLGVDDFFDPTYNILIGCDILNEFIQKYDDEMIAVMLYGMDHNDAWSLYEAGLVPEFAEEIFELRDQFEKGEITVGEESY